MSDNITATDGVNIPQAQQGTAVNVPQTPTHPVVKSDPITSEPSPPPKDVVNFGNYQIPKSIYEDIKYNTTKETERKLMKDLEGKIKSEEEEAALERYRKLREDLGNRISPEGNIDFDNFLKDQVSKATDDLSRKYKKLENDFQSTIQELENQKARMLNDTKQRKLLDIALQNGVSPERVEDFLDLGIFRDRIKMEDDLGQITMRILDDQGGISYNEKGERSSLEDLVKEVLNKKRWFLPAQDTGGAGGGYGRAETTEWKGGPPHLSPDYKKNNVIKVTQGERMRNR